MPCIIISVNFLLNILSSFPYKTCDLGDCQSPRKNFLQSTNFESAFLSEEMYCNSMQCKTNAYSVIHSENAYFSHNRQGEEEFKKSISSDTFSKK